MVSWEEPADTQLTHQIVFDRIRQDALNIAQLPIKVNLLNVIYKRSFPEARSERSCGPLSRAGEPG